MTSEALTGNRVSSVRYELIHVTSRDVYGWVEGDPVDSDVDEDFEDTSYNVVWRDPAWFPMANHILPSRVAGTAHGGTGNLSASILIGSDTANMVVEVPDYATTVSFWYRRSGTGADLKVYDSEASEGAGTLLQTCAPSVNTYTQYSFDVTGLTVLEFDFAHGTIHSFDDLHFDVTTPTFEWTLLDTVQEEASANDLDGVTGGSIDFVANASIKGGGSITIVDRDQDIDWLNDRVKIYYTVEGYGETPLGVFLFSEAPESWSGTGRTWEVKLLDKNAIFDQDAVDENTLVDAGTVVTTQVETYLTGENQAITPSAATLAGPQTFEPGTSYLSIINDLLATIGYFAMTPNGDGQFMVKPYVLPANRAIIWEFLDGENCIYIPDFVNDVDLFSIPNTFIAVGQGDGTTAALTSTYTNTDPESPYSTVSRGRTIVAVEVGIEAADQTTLDDYAQRRLVELTSPTQSIEIQHAYVPGLQVNDAVWFRSEPAGINARHVVTKTVVDLNPTALCTTTLQKVVAL